MELVGIIAGVVAAVFAIVAYLWPRRSKDGAQEAASPSPATPECALDRVMSSRRVRVGMFRYPPFIDYATRHGKVEVVGLFGEMMKWIARRHGLELVCHPMNISDVVHAVEDGRVDMILGVFLTPARAKRVDFAGLVYSFKVGGISLASQTKVRSIGDLQRDDVDVAVCTGEIGHEIAERNLGLPRQRLKVLDTHEIPEIVRLVESGGADVALADSVSLLQYLESRANRAPKLKLLFRRDPLCVCPSGVMVARGQEQWANWLDENLKLAREQDPVRQLEAPVLEQYRTVVQRY